MAFEPTHLEQEDCCVVHLQERQALGRPHSLNGDRDLKRNVQKENHRAVKVIWIELQLQNK